jgi:spore germination protein YaaH
MHDVYDIEITYIKSSNTITIDSLDREQKKAYAAKNISIKSNPKTFSTTVDKVKKGNWLIYVSTDEKGWAKVRTTEGKVGYVKEDKLTNFVTVRDSMEDDSKIDGKVNLVWDYFSEYVKAPDRTGTTIQGINVVSPSFFYIDKNGDFKENVGSQGEEYIEWANSNGYKVWPMVSNSSAGIDVTSKIMNDYESRKELIEEIVDVCVKYKLDGINIDFENMKKEDVDLYSRFIIELTPRIKEIGLAISVDVTAPDGADNWSMCFDRNIIGNVADYIIFMAYDQYGAGSNKAGTTAGYNWVETSLKKFVTTEEIDSDKVILAIPFYTRLWSETEDKVLSKVIDMNEIDETIPDNVERVWNDTLKQYYVEYTDEKYTRKMWIEDINSIKEKLSLIKQYELGGVALWEKDKETDDVWQVIEDALK